MEMVGTVFLVLARSDWHSLSFHDRRQPEVPVLPVGSGKCMARGARARDAYRHVPDELVAIRVGSFTASNGLPGSSSQTELSSPGGDEDRSPVQFGSSRYRKRWFDKSAGATLLLRPTHRKRPDRDKHRRFRSARHSR